MRIPALMKFIRWILFRGYLNFTSIFSFQEARTFITGLFGPKVHSNFPREYRMNGGGCTSDGFYPTTTDGHYEDQGVDVLVQSRRKVKYMNFCLSITR